MDLGLAAGFVFVFLVIGGLETIDRTSFALIALASRAHAFASWAGASAAFLLATGLAVTVGAALVAGLGTGRIGLVRVAGGVFLIGYAAWVYFHPEEEESPNVRGDLKSAFVAAFLTIFLLELGDTTMIFEIVFVANWGWFIVFFAGSLALVTVAAWNVHLGRTIAGRVSPRLLNRIFVVVLTIVGAVTIAYGLAPSAFPTIGFAASF
jgi:putative Ca2+/H+ antiporter (TMEM165/GDT1 family)